MNYKLIIFGMTELFSPVERSMCWQERWVFEGQLHDIMTLDMQKYKKTREIARSLKGLQVERFLEIFDGIPLQTDAQKTIATVKKLA